MGEQERYYWDGVKDEDVTNNRGEVIDCCILDGAGAGDRAAVGDGVEAGDGDGNVDGRDGGGED